MPESFLCLTDDCLRSFDDGQPGKAGHISMWPLYGDPSWKDPLMCHKWAYVPESLIAVLQDAWFKSAQQEPAQFKLREPRDMRITSINP